MRLEKSGEASHERKRSRTWHAMSPKININAPSLTARRDTLRIATLNINGLASATRQAMVEAFVRHDLDLVLLHEVTHQFTTPFSGYDIHYNIGSSRRGTALLRNTLMATNLSRLPSGRAIAVSVGRSTSTCTPLPAHPNTWRWKHSSITTSPVSWIWLLKTFCWTANLIAC